MKKLALMIAVLVGGTAFAQDTNIENEQTETVVTKSTVKTDKGTDVSTKTETKTKTEDIALTTVKGNTGDVNYNYTMKPTEVDSETVYYHDGKAYRFTSDEQNYAMVVVDKNDAIKPIATLRPSTQKGYYILTENGTSKFGYFNANGNFVVESYDPDNDTLVTTVYTINVTPEATVTKKKM